MKNIQKIEKSKKDYSNITFEDRKKIEKMLKEHISRRSIAKILWFWKSTICDEINKFSSQTQWYICELAHNQHLKKQLNKGNILKIETNKPLKEYIIEKLKEDWSPEEISGRIQLFHSDPDFDSYIKYVCHETIYNFIYSEKSKKLRLPALLRRHKKKRTKWYSRGKKWIEVIKERVSIHKREKEINDRSRVWDFESDSVIFSNTWQVLNTNICRKTRLARFELVADKSARSSITVQKHIVYEMEELWVEIYSFTFDNWLENVYHTELRVLWIKTYFCDPYCSYQKGSIENLNLLIRQYLPRKTDFTEITSNDIYIIQEKINNRPKKCLGYLSPNEFFYKETGIKPN